MHSTQDGYKTFIACNSLFYGEIGKTPKSQVWVEIGQERLEIPSETTSGEQIGLTRENQPCQPPGDAPENDKTT
jgi:hypothetical protein